MFNYFASCRCPPQPPARGAARVIWLHISWHRTVCFCFTFFVIHVILFSLCYALSARHFPPSRDCGLCHLSISCWFSSFRFAPCHDGGLREGFDVGFLCHSGCVLPQSPFLVSPPRHAGGTRDVFDGCLPYYSVCVSFNDVSSRFSWLHSEAVQGCGSGFDEPYLCLLYTSPSPRD